MPLTSVPLTRSITFETSEAGTSRNEKRSSTRTLRTASPSKPVARVTGLDGEAVRNVRVLERFSFLEVPESDVPEVLERVNGTTVNGTTLTLETARN